MTPAEEGGQVRSLLEEARRDVQREREEALRRRSSSGDASGDAPGDDAGSDSSRSGDEKGRLDATPPRGMNS